STTLALAATCPAGRAVHAASSSATAQRPAAPLSGSTASPRSPQLEPTGRRRRAAPPPPQPAEPSRAVGDGTDRELLAPPGGDWLRRQRSNTLTGVFKNFSGYDLLRLSRNDLTKSAAWGRASAWPTPSLQRPCRSRLVFFVSQETDSVFHPVYLSQLTYEELFNRITSLFQADGDKISQVLVYGPTSIAVCITDEVSQTRQ
uniref:SLC12 domain-containing protein n=1 Tax=Macrostomum lignano TaxID=282301 RepID=A0A1I8IJ45_9PLAT